MAIEARMWRELGLSDDGVRADRGRDRAGAVADRVGDVLGGVVGALRVSAEPAAAEPVPEGREDTPAGRRGRTRAASRSRPVSPCSSRWRATTIRARWSRFRARRRAWAASSAISSPWGRGPSRCSIRCASANSIEPRARYLLKGVVNGISFYGNCLGRADGGRRAALRGRVPGQLPGERDGGGRGGDGQDRDQQGDRRGQPGDGGGQLDRPGRHRRARASSPAMSSARVKRSARRCRSAIRSRRSA